MEKNTLAAEESVDSIPGPAYEHIVVTTSTLEPAIKSGLISTNILAVTEEEDGDMEDEDCSEGNEEHMDVEYNQEEGEEEQAEPETEDGSFLEDDFNERDDYKENERNLKVTSLNALEQTTVDIAAHSEQVNQIDNSNAATLTTTLVNSAPKLNSQTETVVEASVEGVGICPVPVQIVSALTVKPKLLPMKTKNNKLIMVQVMNDQPVDSTQLGVQSSSPSQISNGSRRTIDELAEAVVSDADKLISPNQEKSPDSLQHNQQQQNVRFLARSSTPLSREFLALQRSVNESKVLSEFVTDAVRKRQKSAPKDAHEQNYAHQQQQQYHHNHHHHYHGEKQRKPSKFAPLKDDSGSSTSSTLQRRSRSKSVNRKSEDILDTSTGKLKRWPSDEKMLKRTNMRSQNSEFVQKQMEFLNRVKHDEGEVSSEADDGERSFVNGGEDDDINMVVVESNTINDSNASVAGFAGSTSSLLDTTLEREAAVNIATTSNVDSVEARLINYWAPPPKRGWDSFCWKCRECVDLFPCSKCVRCFHCTCIKVTAATKLDDSWVCPECTSVENVLNGPKRSSRRNEMSLDVLSQLLSFALKRMKMVKGYTKFLYTESNLLHYAKYIANPVTFTTLQEKIEKRAFRCSEEFLNETKWILHNALILSSGSSSKEVFTAKSILKVCRQETNEIDTCGECYLNANTRTDWFVDVCAQPHLLLWAKLKGFPYWPAKAMGPGQGLSHVNVRFFGEHDRAFVPIKDCFLYSEQDPNTQTGKRSARELADCIKEVEVHIEKIRTKVGAFKYAKFKTPYEPTEELQQLEMMIPGVMDYMKRQQALVPKPSLQYKIVKTADNHLSIIKKACTTESSNDSDHSVSPHKKPSSITSTSCGVGDVKAAIITPKYEVVSKASSDDSNSSKVTAVILKRKSSSEHKKEAGEELELPMPKVIKFDKEENDQRLLAGAILTGNADGNAEASSKRKYGVDTCGVSINTSGSSVDSTTKMTDTTERPRTKHAKHEPRVPMITIKTNANALTVAIGSESKAAPAIAVPISNCSNTTNLNVEAKPTAAVKEELAAAATLAPLTSSPNNAQTLMENLVKNKHGVTIKKISKENNQTPMTKPDECTKLLAAMNTAIEEGPANADSDVKKADAASDTASGTQTIRSTNSTDNDNSNANVNKSAESSSSSSSGTNKMEDSKKSTSKSTTNTHILKDLVPFIEIKKEITSDDEADMQIAANISGQNNKHLNEKASKVTTEAVSTPKANVGTSSQVSLPVVAVPAVLPNLSLVKQEVMSDEEETTAATINATDQELNTTSSSGDNATNIRIAPLPDAVRVGDTMIQRVNAKNQRNTQPSLVAFKPLAQTTPEGAAAMDMPNVQSSPGIHISPPNKRPNTRGVPYGPLPASAVAQSQPQTQTNTISANNTGNRATIQQQQQLPPSSSPPQVQTQSQSPQTLQPLQRARKSFPNRATPDISATRNNFSSAPHSSPALSPPSTSPLANSNDLKRTLLKNSMVSIPRQAWSPHEPQRNATVSSNNTNTHSIPVPPLTAVSKTPAVLAVLGDHNNAGSTNNNNNMLLNTNSVTNVAINSAAIVTPFVTCNGNIGPNGPALLTPLTMSAPPPLAGLSQSSSNILTPTVGAALCSNMPMSGNNINVSGGSGVVSISPAVELPIPQAVGISSNVISAASSSSVDIVTASLTSMVTDAICRGPPRLMQRPNGPLKSDGTTMFPSQAGPVCQTLVENAHKLTDFFISVMEDTMLEMSEGDESVLQAKITILKIELERTKQAYEQEIAELKRTSDLMLSEMRKSMENEKTRISNEIRKQCEQERLRSIEETKKKQWCSNCGREAQFYCCWNTSYCDYPCQQMHWSRHSATCAQTRPTIASASDSLPKTVSTMTTTVSAMGLQQQQQQHVGCGSKNSNNNMMAVTTTTSMSASPQQQSTMYNKSTTNNKKDKHCASKVSHSQTASNSSTLGSSATSSINSIAAANATGVGVASGTATELLKLPSNTYLRTVPQCGNAGKNNSGGGNLRGSTYSVQRVNIPLPITALVQRGNSWELTSAAPNNNVGAANMATITAPGSNVTQAMTQLTSQQQHHQRMLSGGGTGNISGGVGGGTSSNMSASRSNSRNRAAAAALQQTMTNMHSATSGAATSMPCGMLRPTQM
ncbi:MYND-type zinc finger-containing chromatin reader Zmynd8 isoform X1 [Bactrocera oleae]|uniref:MYND-type zinc finger-containing chromatin reader Zmynd8 isoform X1 n=1 Tax=Bactrocera oleae TaxID=104688 RepID=UPI00387E5F0B